MSNSDSSKNAVSDFPSDKYLLLDIDNVPDLTSITAEEALSYLNQSLENLITVYQSTSSFKPGQTASPSKFSSYSPQSESCTSPQASSPSNSEQWKKSGGYTPVSSPTLGKANNSIDTSNHNNDSFGESAENSKLPSPVPADSSEGESVISTDLTKSRTTSASSLASLVNNIKSASHNNNDSSKVTQMDTISDTSNQTLTGSDSSVTYTPPDDDSDLKSSGKLSSDPDAILEEAAVVAAVLIEGTEQRRRSSGRLAPIDSRIIPPSRNDPSLPTHRKSNKETCKREENSESQNNNNSTSNDESNQNTKKIDTSAEKPSQKTKATIVSLSDSNTANDSSCSETSTVSPSQRSAVSKTEMVEKGLIIKRFWSRNPPAISVWQYLQRIHKYAPLSISVYLSASLYIYRLCIELQTILLTPLSVHRILLASLRIACKTIEDINYTHKRFAAVGGVAPMDLYRLEIAFLFLIDFDICINKQVLQEHLVVLTELQIQADRHRKLLNKKRPRSADPASLDVTS